MEEPESLLEEDVLSVEPAVAVFGERVSALAVFEALYGGSPSVDVGS